MINDRRSRPALSTWARLLSGLLFTTLCGSPLLGQDLLIRGGTVVDGARTPSGPVDLLVLDGTIAEIGQRKPLPEGLEVVDADGRFLVPGLVDLHVHFGRGVPLRPDPRETEIVLRRLLYSGVTSILQLGATDGSVGTIRDLRRRHARGELVGPHIYGTGGHITLQGTHPVYTLFPPPIRAAADRLAEETALEEPVDLDSLGLGLSLVRTERAARRAVRDRAAGGMHAIKITVESGPTPFGDDHPQMSEEMIAAIVDEARRSDLRVFAHVSSTDELRASLSAGAAGVVHAARNLPLPDRQLARRMAAADFFVVPTLSLYATPPDFDDPFLRETVSQAEIEALSRPGVRERVSGRWRCCAPFEELLGNIAMLHAVGVPIAAGTDTGNPFIFPGYQIHRELELLVAAGLDPIEALTAATATAARMLGREEEFGALRPGQRADLLILRSDPRVDIRNTRTLETVILAGRVIDRSTLLRP